jgi:ketosteroid isomerase-like protein
LITSAAPEPSLTRDEIADRVLRLIGARAVGGLAEIGALLDPNVSLKIIGDPLAIYPFPSRRFGREAVLELVTSLRSIFRYEDMEVLNLIVDGDRATVLRRAKMIDLGSGRSNIVHVNDWFRFRRGLVVEVLQINDNAAMRKALGIV